MPNENEVQSLVINTSPITVEEVKVANKNTQKLHWPAAHLLFHF